MNQDQEGIYYEGYRDYQMGESENPNPYTILDAKYWSDDWEDSAEDESQSGRS